MLVHALGLEHRVERVEQRPQVGIDLRHHVARKGAQTLAGLDRRARQHDPIDLAARQRGDGHSHREERLAGARRADPDRDRRVADRIEVALLVQRLRLDAHAAVRPDDVLEDPARRLVLGERAADGLDRAGRDLEPLPDEVGHLLDH